MRTSPGLPLQVVLRFGEGDVLPVGRLAYRNRLAYLEYDETFLGRGLEISPVHHRRAPGLVRPHDAHVFEGLHGVFHDSLPDVWGRLLVGRRARQLRIDPAELTPLDRLACVGDRGMGALCYQPESEAWRDQGQFLDLNELAAGAREVLDGGAEDVIAQLGRLGGSPGGTRPKVLLALDESGIPAQGGEDAPEGYTRHLVKFQGIDDPPDAAQIEQAYTTMAKAAGVRVPETRLIQGRRGEHYFASRRFDRMGGNRLHAHTASGLLYADFRLPSLDYKDLILLTRFLTRDSRQCRAMFILAAFNVMAHNRDDHARQFTFLMDREGNWQLAPAYDLTFAQGPGGEHSSSILGKGKEITKADLISLGKQADLSDKEVQEVTSRVADAVSDWTKFAKDSGVTAASRNRIGQALRH